MTGLGRAVVLITITGDVRGFLVSNHVGRKVSSMPGVALREGVHVDVNVVWALDAASTISHDKRAEAIDGDPFAEVVVIEVSRTHTDFQFVALAVEVVILAVIAFFVVVCGNHRLESLGVDGDDQKDQQDCFMHGLV